MANNGRTPAKSFQKKLKLCRDEILIETSKPELIGQSCESRSQPTQSALRGDSHVTVKWSNSGCVRWLDSSRESLEEFNVSHGDSDCIIVSSDSDEGGAEMSKAPVDRLTPVAGNSAVIDMRMPVTEHSAVIDRRMPVTGNTAVIDMRMPVTEHSAVIDMRMPVTEHSAVIGMNMPVTEHSAVIDMRMPVTEHCAVIDRMTPVTEHSAVVDRRMPVTEHNAVIDRRMPVTEHSAVIDRMVPVTEHNVVIDRRMPVTEHSAVIDRMVPVTEHSAVIDRRMPVTDHSAVIDRRMPVTDHSAVIDRRMPVTGNSAVIDRRTPVTEHNAVIDRRMPVTGNSAVINITQKPCSASRPSMQVHTGSETFAPASNSSMHNDCIDDKAASNSSMHNDSIDDKAASNSSMHNDSIDDKAASNSSMHNDSIDDKAASNSSMHYDSIDDKAASNSSMHYDSIDDKAASNSSMHNDSIDDKAASNSSMHNDSIDDKAADSYDDQPLSDILKRLQKGIPVSSFNHDRKVGSSRRRHITSLSSSPPSSSEEFMVGSEKWKISHKRHVKSSCKKRRIKYGPSSAKSKSDNVEALICGRIQHIKPSNVESSSSSDDDLVMSMLDAKLNVPRGQRVKHVPNVTSKSHNAQTVSNVNLSRVSQISMCGQNFNISCKRHVKRGVSSPDKCVPVECDQHRSCIPDQQDHVSGSSTDSRQFQYTMDNVTVAAAHGSSLTLNDSSISNKINTCQTISVNKVKDAAPLIGEDSWVNDDCEECEASHIKVAEAVTTSEPTHDCRSIHSSSIVTSWPSGRTEGDEIACPGLVVTSYPTIGTADMMHRDNYISLQGCSSRVTPAVGIRLVKDGDRSQDISQDRSQDRSGDRPRSKTRDRSRDRYWDRSGDRFMDRSRDRSRDMYRKSSRDRCRSKTRDRSLSKSRERSRDKSQERYRQMCNRRATVSLVDIMLCTCATCRYVRSQISTDFVENLNYTDRQWNMIEASSLQSQHLGISSNCQSCDVSSSNVSSTKLNIMCHKFVHEAEVHIAEHSNSKGSLDGCFIGSQMDMSNEENNLSGTAHKDQLLGPMHARTIPWSVDVAMSTGDTSDNNGDAQSVGRNNSRDDISDGNAEVIDDTMSTSHNIDTSGVVDLEEEEGVFSQQDDVILLDDSDADDEDSVFANLTQLLKSEPDWEVDPDNDDISIILEELGGSEAVLREIFSPVKLEPSSDSELELDGRALNGEAIDTEPRDCVPGQRMLEGATNQVLSSVSARYKLNKGTLHSIAQDIKHPAAQARQIQTETDRAIGETVEQSTENGDRLSIDIADFVHHRLSRSSSDVSPDAHDAHIPSESHLEHAPDTAVESCQRQIAPDTAIELCQRQIAPDTAIESHQRHIAPDTAVESCQRHIAPNTVIESCQRHLAPDTAIESSQRQIAPDTAVESRQRDIAPNTVVESCQRHFAPDTAIESRQRQIAPDTAFEPCQRQIAPDTALELRQRQIAPDTAFNPRQRHIAPNTAFEPCQLEIAPDTAVETRQLEIAPDTAFEPRRLEIAPNTAFESRQRHIAPDTAFESSQLDIAPDTAFEPRQLEITPDTAIEPFQRQIAPDSAFEPRQLDIATDTAFEPRQRQIAPDTAFEPRQRQIAPDSAFEPRQLDIATDTAFEPRQRQIAPDTAFEPRQRQIAPDTAFEPRQRHYVPDTAIEQRQQAAIELQPCPVGKLSDSSKDGDEQIISDQSKATHGGCPRRLPTPAKVNRIVKPFNFGRDMMIPTPECPPESRKRKPRTEGTSDVLTEQVRTAKQQKKDRELLFYYSRWLQNIHMGG